MSESINIELGNVQKTMLLPLWGRAVETGKEHPLLIDKTAVEMIAKIDYDFTTIQQNISYISQLAWIARCLHIDNTIRGFLMRHPRGTIVNIGCGLDTTFERVDNGLLKWYDLDLPDVIALRSKFIPANERRQFITSSFLDEKWLSELDITDNVLFIAAGVLYYFEEAQIKVFLKRLADLFPGGEMIFDACTPQGVRVANQKVIKDSGMDEKSFLKWGINRAGEITSRDPRLKVLEEYPMFKNIKRRLKLREKIGTCFSDVLNIMYMVYLRFEK